MADESRSDGVRDASGKFKPGHPFVGRRTRRQGPRDVDPDLALADARTLGDLYERLVKLWDTGRLSPSQVRAGVELVRLRALVVGAEETERRLAALEARAARGARADAEDK